MKRLESIQMLRAVAASLIVIHHIVEIERIYGDSSSRWLYWFRGDFGVDIFFVISGFIMVYITFDKASSMAYSRKFLLKRIIRVVPPYWFYTSIVVALMLLIPQMFRNMQFDPIQVIKSYLFIPQQGLPVLQVGWSLEYEMYFYLLFAVLLLLPRRMLLPALTTIFGVSVLLGLLINFNSKIYMVLTNWVLFEFLLGVYIGYFFVKGQRLNMGLAWSMLIAGVLLIAYSFVDHTGGHRLFFWGIPSSLIVLGALNLEDQGISFSGILAYLGNSSYSLYLSHIFVLFAVGKVWAVLGFSGYVGNVVLILGAYVICLLVAVVSYKIIEQGSTTYLTARWLKNKKTPVQEGMVKLSCK